MIPGFLSDHLTPALWFDVAGAALLSAANPPLDAARLDIMPAGLWGRAESVRTFVRSLAQALAPLLFGGSLAWDRRHLLRAAGADRYHVGAIELGDRARPRDHIPDPAGHARCRGRLLLRARSTYPRDVATAAASHQGAGDLEAAGQRARAVGVSEATR